MDTTKQKEIQNTKIKALEVLNDSECFILITNSRTVICGQESDLVMILSSTLGEQFVRNLFTKAALINMIDARDNLKTNPYKND